MRNRDAEASRRLLEQVWNEDDHASLLDVVAPAYRIDDEIVRSERRGPIALLNFIDAYKAFVPDLLFHVDSQTAIGRELVTRWSARGRHVGMAAGVAPSRGPVELNGELIATSSARARRARFCGGWDTPRFLRQVGATVESLNQYLNPAADRIAIRAIQDTEGVTTMLFPTMSMPGWTTWKRAIGRMRAEHPVATFQFLGNRRAIERTRVDDTYGVKAENRALRRALADAGIRGPFDIVGHSIGGTLALDFALDYPEETRSLVLIEPGPAWVLKTTGAMTSELTRFVDERLNCYAKRMTEATYAEFVRRSAGIADHDPTQLPHWPLFRVYMQNMQFRPALLTHTDDPQRLKNISCPVMLINGTESVPYYREITRILRTYIGHAHVIAMEGGHVPHVGKGVEPFLDHLRRFKQGCVADELAVCR